MIANSFALQIEQELTTFLQHFTEAELRKTTKKQCVAYLEQKLNTSMSKQKPYIKSLLKQFVMKYLASKKTGNTASETPNETRKRKLSGSMETISEPPLKKIKHNQAQNMDINNIQSPINDDYKDPETIKESENVQNMCMNTSEKCIESRKQKRDKVSSLAMIISPLSPQFSSLKSIESVEEMTSLIKAENLMSELNHKLSHNDGEKKDINYDNIEYESMKNRLTKCEEECVKCKNMVKHYASLLQPHVVQCKDLKKENEILNKNIEILKNQTTKEIEKMKNALKNESENVKEERYKRLRTDKEIERMKRKFDFICNKYKIDKDSVVVEMG